MVHRVDVSNTINRNAAITVTETSAFSDCSSRDLDEQTVDMLYPVSSKHQSKVTFCPSSSVLESQMTPLTEHHTTPFSVV